jgi:uncharacterized Zn-binding protein involved in type VI secretion
MKVARLGDIAFGICYCHIIPITVEGIIISASTDTYANSRGVARLGDIVFTSCGHFGTIITASTKTYANSRGIARLGDVTAGCFVGTIITASNDVDAG